MKNALAILTASLVIASVSYKADRLLAAELPQADDPNIIAIIGPYRITGEEFRQEYLDQMRPNPYSAMPPKPAPDPNEVLMDMIADKAIILAAREAGVHKRDNIAAYIDSLRQQRLAGMAANLAVGPEVTVTEKDINDVMARTPRLTREQAASMARNRKAQEILNAHLTQLARRLNLKEFNENVAKVASLHHRLITKPKPPEKKNIYWIEKSQIETDLDPNERAMVLAQFDGGRFTVEDWFSALCEMAPPRRPKDLDTPQGAERFLAMVIRRPLLVAEAVEKGLEKDEQLVEYLHKVEDQMVLSAAQQDLYKDINEPNDRQIAEFYQTVRGVYGKNDSLKVKMIWCKDRATASRIVEQLAQGQSFELAQQRYAGDGNEPAAVDVYPVTEGPFWAELWKAEPNQLVGPILGFRPDGLAWRIVKILEKHPAKEAEFDKIKNMLREDLAQQHRQQILDRRRRQLLSRYPHRVFSERLKAYDPRNVP